MADVHASDGGEEDLQRERCWEVSFTERRMRCRLKAFRHLVPRLNVQPVRSYNVGGNTKIKKGSRSIKTIIKISSSHTLKKPILQFVNVNGARRPSLFFKWGWKTIPQLSSVLLCIPIFLRASYQNELWCNRFPFFFAPFVTCWVFPARCLLVRQKLVAYYSRGIFQRSDDCRFDRIIGFFLEWLQLIRLPITNDHYVTWNKIVFTLKI